MRKRIIINTANLSKGGALQVAASFVTEATKIPHIDFCIVLGVVSASIIDEKEYEESSSHLAFMKLNIRPAKSLKSFIKYRKALSHIEDSFKPDGVITVFGPCYWTPKAAHIMGFARPHLIYGDTYYFQHFNRHKSVVAWLQKLLHIDFLKRESKLYWTETKDSQQRLSVLTKVPEKDITVASNNCNHFFRSAKHDVYHKVPQKIKTRLLYLSSYYPHKGFELIPSILDRLAQKGIDVEILLTIDTSNFERLFVHYDNVINLGSVEPKYCPYLYEVSDIVFAPTLLEVFSAVYPEAMYSQKPIITTDLPFTRSICGDAALYFDPSSTDDAADKIQQLLTHPSLKEGLIANGLKRLKDFDLPEERFGKVLDSLLREIE